MISYEEMVGKLREIKDKGWIRTHRSGTTGIGKTLEDLLGIPENNIPSPNGIRVELKSARKNATSMLTLFTKSPLPDSANTVLLRRFGYPSRRENGRNELHTTVNAVDFNNLRGRKGFKIRISCDRIDLITPDLEIVGYWDRETLKESFERKLPKVLYVKAESRGTRDNEEFWFNEAWLLSEFDFNSFVNLLREKVILVDIRIGQYLDGRPHDHGTGFRVLPAKLDLCFLYREKVI